MTDKQRAMHNVMESIERYFHNDLARSGIMYRLFARVKTMRSLRHKMEIKGDSYRSGKKKIQDVIGLRVVLYFPEDVEILATYFSCLNLVDSAVDNHDTSTFMPKRLNLTKHIPAKFVPEFRAALPDEFAPYIDATYEIQIRTIFSEGWHEVEHDLRYKCKEQWKGYENYSRTLNGIFATLETAEWSMCSLFKDMAIKNALEGSFTAMMRNKMRLRFANDSFSPEVFGFLHSHPDIVHTLLMTDRMVFVLTLLAHRKSFPLTFDNALFFINRFEIRDEELRALESEETAQMIDEVINS